MASTATPVDLRQQAPASLRARRAALIGHGAKLDDPEIIEIDQALAYWKCRRVIDAQRDSLNPEHIPALADMLRHAHPVVPA